MTFLKHDETEFGYNAFYRLHEILIFFLTSLEHQYLFDI